MFDALLSIQTKLEIAHMVKIRITKPFRLTNRDGTQTDYAPGDHDFPEGSEDHFFIKAHSDKAADAKPGLGTAAHVESMRAVAEARRKAVAEADELVREAEEAHMSREEQEARKAGIAAGLQVPKPQASVQGGPNVEGAAREISPGLKGLPDRDAAVGGLIDQPEPIVDQDASILDDLGDEGTDANGDNPEELAAERKAKDANLASRGPASDTTTNTSAPKRPKVDPKA
jgi:hypothetical protein